MSEREGGRMTPGERYTPLHRLRRKRPGVATHKERSGVTLEDYVDVEQYLDTDSDGPEARDE